jgi:hypothetical protein
MELTEAYMSLRQVIGFIFIHRIISIGVARSDPSPRTYSGGAILGLVSKKYNIFVTSVHFF